MAEIETGGEIRRKVKRNPVLLEQDGAKLVNPINRTVNAVSMPLFRKESTFFACPLPLDLFGRKSGNWKKDDLIQSDKKDPGLLEQSGAK